MQTEESIRDPLYLFVGKGRSFTDDVHNQYIRNLIETGIIGSVAYFLLVFVILRSSYSDFLRTNDRFVRGLAVGIMASTLSLILINITAEAFLVVKISEVYWFFAAIYAASCRLKKCAESQA